MIFIARCTTSVLYEGTYVTQAAIVTCFDQSTVKLHLKGMGSDGVTLSRRTSDQRNVETRATYIQVSLKNVETQDT